MIHCKDLIPYISTIKTQGGKELTVGTVEAVASTMTKGLEYHIELMDGPKTICTFVYNANGTVVERLKEYLGDYISDWSIVSTGYWTRFQSFATIKKGARLLLQNGQEIVASRIESPVWVLGNNMVVVPENTEYAIMMFDSQGKNKATANHNLVGYANV